VLVGCLLLGSSCRYFRLSDRRINLVIYRKQSELIFGFVELVFWFRFGKLCRCHAKSSSAAIEQSKYVEDEDETVKVKLNTEPST